jgi:hypothetical protein
MNSPIAAPEIEALGRWDQVRFAVQCAHRVLPLFSQYHVRGQHHLPALKVAVTLARARAALGDELPAPYDPLLPIQLIDHFELEALGTTLRAVNRAAIKLKAEGTAPEYMWKEDYGREVTIYVAISSACLGAFRAAFGPEPVEGAISAWVAVCDPLLPEAELLARELQSDFNLLRGIYAEEVA